MAVCLHLRGIFVQSWRQLRRTRLKKGRGRTRTGALDFYAWWSSGWRIRWLVDTEINVMTTDLFARKTQITGISTVTTMLHNINLWSRFGSLSARCGLWHNQICKNGGFQLIILIYWRDLAFAAMRSIARGDHYGILGIKQNKELVWFGVLGGTEILTDRTETPWQQHLSPVDGVKDREDVIEIRQTLIHITKSKTSLRMLGKTAGDYRQNFNKSCASQIQYTAISTTYPVNTLAHWPDRRSFKTCNPMYARGLT